MRNNPIENGPTSTESPLSKEDSVALLNQLIAQIELALVHSEVEFVSADNEVGRLRIEVVAVHHQLDAASEKQRKSMRRSWRLQKKLGQFREILSALEAEEIGE